MKPVYGAIAALVGTVALVYLVALITDSFSDRTKKRVKGLMGDGTPPPTSGPTGGKRDLLPNVTNLLSGKGLTEQLYTALASAGMSIRPSEFLGIVAGSALFAVLVAAAFVGNALELLLIGVIAAIIPVMVMRAMQARRRAQFDAQIVDALMMISSSLRSGFGFQRSIQIVSQEMPPPISIEFQRVINEVNVGRTLEEALKGIVGRVQSYDFDLVVTAVIIQHQVGGNLADILSTIANTIRERVRINGELRALTAEGRISGVVLVALPIVIGLVLTVLNPSYMHVLVYETIGHYLLGAALVLQLIGALIIRKMLVLDI